MGQYTSYYLYQKYEKRGEQGWIPSYPNQFSIDGEGSMPLVVREQADTSCGYNPIYEPIYRWVESGYTCEECGYVPPPTPSTQYREVTVQGQYWCDGTTKKEIKKQQSSTDGINWTDTGVIISADTVIAYNSTDCGYTPPSDYNLQYLTFIPTVSPSVFSFQGTSSNTLSYSTDGGSTWHILVGESPSISVGQKILFKGQCVPISGNDFGIGRFSSTADFKAEGNVMSLLFGDNFTGQTSLSGKDYAFHDLFNACRELTNCENLKLPATTLAYACYGLMFADCSNLTKAPQLPSLNLSDWCYDGMFNGCRSLTTAPQLPSTNLAEYCYNGMFYACDALSSVPQLPATTLYTACYQQMFQGCVNVATAPDLSASTLAERCYDGMFWGCSKLNYVKCLATDISAYNCTNEWLHNVMPSGTFVKATSMSDWTNGDSGIPNGWTVQDA